jgi:hypothetical protein
LPSDRKYLLSATCRTFAGSDVPRILTSTIETLIGQAPRFSVPEQLNAVLDLIARKSDGIGTWSTFDQQVDYPLLGSRSANELGFLIGTLIKRGYLRQKPPELTITVEGWERLEEVRRSGRQSALVFVAMWFHESTNALYDGAIMPAIREAGYEPIRVDRHEHINRIDDEIIGQIRRSRFLVADFTGQRHGVYFEAGLMAGLGRNVIWMCQHEDLANVHFDVRQYNFIDWVSLDDARRRLLNRILAVEGEGPHPQTN